jgi:hypothetical protein
VKSPILPVLVLTGSCLALSPAWGQQTGTTEPKGREEKAAGSVQGSQQTQPSPSPGASQGGQQRERPGEPSPGQRATRPSTPGTAGTGQEARGEKQAGERQRGEARTGEMAAGREGQENIREVQQALKEKGFDPGPIDGMGPSLFVSSLQLTPSRFSSPKRRVPRPLARCGAEKKNSLVRSLRSYCGLRGSRP